MSPELWLPEWAEQDAVLLAWPPAHSDWSDSLAQVRACYAQLIQAITRYQAAVVIASDREAPGDIPIGSDFEVTVLRAPLDDTWVRDSGPLTVLDESGKPVWLDFRFNAWGGKFAAERDDALVQALHRTPCFDHLVLKRHERVLEGGAIESDGGGTILTTARCMQARAPEWSRARISQWLCSALGMERVLWLEHGEIIGDDTDGHVDTVARFASPQTIVFQGCDRPEDAHYASLQAMASELEALRTSDGKPYTLVELPLPQPVYAGTRRLPATYANFLIINGAVLVPTYGDENDALALSTLAAAFPDREVVGLDCRPLIEQGGSLHCATMQLPRGTYRCPTPSSSH